MAKRERRVRYTAGSDNIKTPQHKAGRLARPSYAVPQEDAKDAYAASARRVETPSVEEYTPYGAPEEAASPLPAVVDIASTTLAVTDLDPLYTAIAEMRARIDEAGRNKERSQQAQQILKTEMETASQLAEEAESELKEVARKVAYLKHEAEQVCSEGLVLQQQLSTEEQYWQNKLKEEQLMLADAEQKLRIAEEEAQRVGHAKEVAARMNEREMWRLGSSKQGLWLQRRKVQGNALPMTRGKDGGWQMPKVVASPGATYAQTVLEREQKHTQKLQDEYDPQEKKRLNMLAQSAQALTERGSSQLEESFLEQLAAREAERHLANAAQLLAGAKAANTPPEPVPPEPVLPEPAPPEPVLPEPAPVKIPPQATAIAEEAPPPVPPVEAAVAEDRVPAPLLNADILELLRSIETPTRVLYAVPTEPALNEDIVAPPPSIELSLNKDIVAALRCLETPLKAEPAPEAGEPAEAAMAAAQNLPEDVDPLQFLAMRAASYTAAGQPAAVAMPPSAFNGEIPSNTEPAAIPNQEEDIQRLALQANLLAQQHLTQHRPEEKPAEPPAGRIKIAQKVAEETGRQDHLLKEQQTAEMAIAAAMAAARKAAQSAMAISEQVNQQIPALDSRGLVEEDRPYSVERIIADALSKAAVADQYNR